MAKAHQAPNERKLRYDIREHAMERFDERFGNWCQKEGMLDPKARLQFLDFLISAAVDELRFEDLFDVYHATSRRLTRVVDISDYDRWPGEEALVVMTSQGSAITVLTGEMGRENIRRGSWQRTDNGRKLARLSVASPLTMKLPLLPLLQGFDAPPPLPDSPVIVLDPPEPKMPDPKPDLITVSKTQLIAAAATLIEAELKQRAAHAFFDRNMPLAEVLRDLSESLPSTITAKLEELP